MIVSTMVIMVETIVIDDIDDGIDGQEWWYYGIDDGIVNIDDIDDLDDGIVNMDDYDDGIDDGIVNIDDFDVGIDDGIVNCKTTILM